MTSVAEIWGLPEPKTFTRRGFDYFYGFLSGGHCYLPENVTTIKPLKDTSGQFVSDAKEGYFLPLMRNDQAGDFNEYLTTALSRDAARFVAQGDQPFCLYLAFRACL